MKLNQDFMDRAIRPNVPALLEAIELANSMPVEDYLKEGVINGALLEFLAAYEDAKWQPIEMADKKTKEPMIGIDKDGVMAVFLPDWSEYRFGGWVTTVFCNCPTVLGTPSFEPILWQPISKNMK